MLLEGPGLVATAAATPAQVQIQPGDSWNFQAFYREPGGACDNGANLSNAIDFTN